MSNPTCIQFQADADFSLIRYNTGFGGCADFKLRFMSQQPGIYDASVEYRHNFPHNAYFPLTENQVEEVLSALIQMIELYTLKYPDRMVRLKGGGNKFQSTIFRVMVLMHRDVLTPLFIIDVQEKKSFLPFSGGGVSTTFTLKRRPDVGMKGHPVQTVLHTQSRLFGNPVHVRVCPAAPC
jgi:hypothetical protein